jgi:ABC-type branched-subunit amino acid transport system substrate-binding protein
MPSSVISAMAYDATSLTLKITYVSGKVYEYRGVPETIYKEMKASGAKGIYLNHHIKGSYPFERIS